MSLPQTGAKNFHAQLELPDKGRAIKGLGSSIARNNNLRDGSMDNRRVRGLVPCCGQDGCRSQVTPHPHRLIQIHSYHKA